MQFENLRYLRERLFRYPFQAVVRLSGIEAERLAAIEADEAPSVAELESLSRLYGIEADSLGDVPIVLERDDGVQVLALLEEFQDIDWNLKAQIIGAANAARDGVQLRVDAGEQRPWDLHVARKPVPRAPKSLAPHQAGRHYATRVRKLAGLGNEPLPSVRDFVSHIFPEITVYYAHLGAAKLAGITIADSRRGPSIILNLDGKNENPCVRRFSLAHELCHVLVDSDRMEPLAQLSGFRPDEGLAREQQANAFAMRLLCPEDALKRVVQDAKRDPVEIVRTLIATYGVHYQAARLFLRNECGLDVPAQMPPDLVRLSTSEAWSDAERPAGLSSFPLAEVPPERRTTVAQYAAQAFSQGRISRDRFATLLRVGPEQALERVLDFFALDYPLDALDYPLDA